MHVYFHRPETSKNWKIVTETEKSETVPTEGSAEKGAMPFRLQHIHAEIENIASKQNKRIHNDIIVHGVWFCSQMMLHHQDFINIHQSMMTFPQMKILQQSLQPQLWEVQNIWTF